MAHFVLAVTAFALAAWPLAAARAQSGGAAARTIAIVGPQAVQQAACVPISNVTDLSNIRNNLSGNYCLTRDINASSVANFVPIGDNNNRFTGVLDGRGHVIRKLTIDSSALLVGLFGYLAPGSVVRDLGLVDASVTASPGVYVGILAGFNQGTIRRSHATGSVTASGDNSRVGGLVGQNNETIAQSHSAVSVSVGDNGIAGGLVGLNGDTITQSYASGPVSGGLNTAIGGLVGNSASNSEITQSHATGRSGGGAGSRVGGLVGDGRGDIKQSYATGAVSGGADSDVGGLMGKTLPVTGQVSILTSYATGSVRGSNDANVGGLVGFADDVLVFQSFATGPVSGGAIGGTLGGLVGRASVATVRQSHATGSVSGGINSRVGGLVGTAESGAVLESWAAGRLTGDLTPFGRVGGLIGSVADTTATSSFWDKQTSGDGTSAGGAGVIGRTTAQLQAGLPSGFSSSIWGITQGASYPFLKVGGLDFDAPLAITVFANRIYTFLPISQLDPAQYLASPEHADEASRAAVFTMLARAIGVTKNVAELKDVLIDKFFWDDATQQASFRGPVRDHATLVPMISIPAAQPIGDNVIGPLKARKLVIIRGSFNKVGGGLGTHTMLATLFTANDQGAVTSLVANDPWTGRQVRIDPATKTVRSPANFPLAGFKVNGFQVVTLN